MPNNWYQSRYPNISKPFPSKYNSFNETNDPMLSEISDIPQSTRISSCNRFKPDKEDDSPWCLDELVVISECRENLGQTVLRVFYRVDPTDVQELRGPFAKALFRLLQDHSDRSHNLGGWCHALKIISNDLSAFVSNEINLHAFHQNEPKDGYVELSQQVISYAQGNPLALKVLGSNLYWKETEYWESQLLKLKSIPNMRIQDILKVSYERLDRDEQRIFLDIACLFRGRQITEVENLLESFGFFATSGIRSLVDKSLTDILDFTVSMHNLLQQMGKEIVNEESKQPGGRSRLWNPRDISHVFKTNSPLGNLKVVDLSGSKSLIRISDSFEAPNLEELYLGGCESLVEIPSSLKYSRNLAWLELNGCLEREDILGFCFCAVIDPQLLNSHRSSITCLAKLEDKSGKIYDFHFTEIELMSKELDSKHVFLLYKTLNCECFTQASFQFAIEDYDYNTAKYVQVSKGMIKCGVHPISWKQYRTRLISKLEMIKTKKNGIGIRE
ncbi:hypothetical protein JCGZ_04983 [Jatropha curcas]|uniref:Uncharacterized protein n=1 Tax=Jatropha curcas TaxID=180498 RepID=A0A067KRI9_JATCU|nr:hypothetical protein JCGZ_04983 [Jatropha curcas]